MGVPGEEARRRVRRASHVLCTWQATGKVVQSARRPTGVPASVLILDVLDRLDSWTDVDALAGMLDLPAAALSVLLDGLQAHDLVEVDVAGSGALPRAAGPWAAWSPTALLFHLATRDVTFARREASAPSTESPPRPPAVIASRSGMSVPLPLPTLGDGTLRGALHDRRTHRRFGLGTIDARALGTLLGVTFGVQAWAQTEEGPLALKTSPSGGARHSLEAYIWARHVEELPAGLYHYRPAEHALTRLEQPPALGSVTRWLPMQTGYEGAGVVVVLASVLARVAWRYRSARAYRVVLIEAGHLGQAFCLTATALGLAPFCTGALADSVIEGDLGIDGLDQPVMYAVGAGLVAPGDWQPHEGRPAPPLEVTDLGRALGDPPVTRRRP